MSLNVFFGHTRNPAKIFTLSDTQPAIKNTKVLHDIHTPQLDDRASITQQVTKNNTQRVIYPTGDKCKIQPCRNNAAAKGYTMDIYNIRLTNALILIERAGSRTKTAERLEMSYNLLNQYLGANAKKRIGDQLARKFEKAFGLADYAMDQPIRTTPDVALMDDVQTSALSVDAHLRYVPVIGAIMPTENGHGAVIKTHQQICFVKVPSAQMNSVVYIVEKSSFGNAVRVGWYLCCSKQQPKNRDFVLITGESGQTPLLGECIDVQGNQCTIDLLDDSKKRVSVEMSHDFYVVTAMLPPSTDTHDRP